MTLTLKTSLTLDVHSINGKHWIIIGAGGNGGYFIASLARIVALSNAKLKLGGRPEHKITVIDADDVEEKNLMRQNFIRADIGKKKAFTLAQRYSRAYGIEINYIDGYMNTPEMLRSLAQATAIAPVVVGAVDNNKTRAIIYQVFKDHQGMFWLDAGNEEWGGQVVLGYNAGMMANKDHERNAQRKHAFNLPSVAHLYPEILEATDKLPNEMSCAERAVSNPQNIFTNQTAANLMTGFANVIINSDPLTQTGLKYHAVIFNTQTSACVPRLNYLEELSVPAPIIPAPEKVVEVKVSTDAKKVKAKDLIEVLAEA